MSNIPAELLYTAEHEWVKIEGNIATIGVTDFAQSELGDIVYVDIDTVEDEVEKDAVFGSIEAVKTVSDLFSPLSGTVLEMNEAIESEPELINSDAYEKGWVIKLELSNTEEVETLLSAEAYKELLGE